MPFFSPKNDLFLRRAQEHVKYVTTDANTEDHFFPVYDGISKNPLFFTQSRLYVCLWNGANADVARIPYFFGQ